MKSRRVLVPLFLALAILCAVFAVQAADDAVAVQILGINDFHGTIQQSGKVDNRLAGGAAVLAAWIKERALTNPHTLLVSAGDMVGASQPISALLQDEPTIDLLNYLGFDVAVPGNHEFDEGYAEMVRLYRGGYHPTTGYYPGASFPLVLANVVDAKTKNPILPPYVVKVVEGIPIGFIGVISMETPTIVVPSAVQGLSFLDPVASVNKYVSELRAKGVETLIVVAHEGGLQNKDTKAIEGPIAAIANGVDDAVDVIISGHTHTVLNGVVDGKLIVQANSKGYAFADVDLTLSRATGNVTSAKGEVVTTFVDEKKPDERIAKLLAPVEAKVRPLLEQKITETTAEITRTQNEAGESALGNLIADAQKWATKAQIAFMNPGGIRRDLPADTITWGVLFECQPFGNNMMRFTLTGDQIVRILNQQWTTKRILQIAGIKYVWDDKRAIDDKVVKVTLADGTPLDKAKTYVVAANNFLAAGGDGFSVFKESGPQELVINDLDALIEYLKTQKMPIAVKIEGRITKAS